MGKKKKISQVFKIKMFYDKPNKRMVGPGFDAAMLAQFPFLQLIQNSTILMSDIQGNLPPLQMREGVEERVADIVVYEKEK